MATATTTVAVPTPVTPPPAEPPTEPASRYAEGKKIHWVLGFEALWALLKYRAITWGELATPRLQSAPSEDETRTA